VGFQYPYQAAEDAMDWIYNPEGGIPNWFFPPSLEYAGTVYQGDFGLYYATVPNAGQDDNAAPSYPPGGPGAAVLALYHTHGSCSPKLGLGNDVFSNPTPTDRRSDKTGPDFRGVPGYLETPGWMILEYDPDPTMQQQGPTTEIRPGAFCYCSKR